VKNIDFRIQRVFFFFFIMFYVDAEWLQGFNYTVSATRFAPPSCSALLLLCQLWRNPEIQLFINICRVTGFCSSLVSLFWPTILSFLFIGEKKLMQLRSIDNSHVFDKISFFFLGTYDLYPCLMFSYFPF